jgi:2-oxoisovalerate dehydrogenase E1 component alpha subunit
MVQHTSVNQVAKHTQLGLSDEQAIEMYRYMLLARKFDERGLVLQRAGKINFHVSGIGQEAAQVGAAFALQKEHDFFLPYYRDYAFVLAVGMTTKELMLSIFAKAEDPNSAGRQMPGHFSHRKLNIVTGSSPVTTQVPHATLGDGSSNQGDFHEGLNFAGVFKLPVIVMVENNQYAISTPYSRQVASETIAQRATSYGMPGVRVDGNDPLEVYRVVKEARERAINGDGATLVEAVMYRLSPHSTSDNDLAYRSKEEVDENWEKDGLPKYRNYLIEAGIWSEEQDAALHEEINKELKEATEYGDKAAYPKPEDTLTHVYGEE